MHPILAYIDGGSASMALQLLLAGLLSGVYAFHTKLNALRRFISRKRQG